MSVIDPLANAADNSALPDPHIILSTTPPPHDPPPPYPSQERRIRTPRSGRRRRTVEQSADNATLSSAPTGGPDYETLCASSQQYDSGDNDVEATEATPLLYPSTSSSSPRTAARLPSGILQRQRTLSLTSTVRSIASVAPSLAQTVLSAFNPERDADLDPECEFPEAGDDYQGEDSSLDSPTLRHSNNFDHQQRALVAELSSQRLNRPRTPSWRARWRRYFRPMAKRAYYAALFHLLVFNFPYALLAWIYIFVFTVTGTTTLMALPLGAALCFIDLIGARIISRGELALQTTFHGPLAYTVPNPPLPIFVRFRPPSASEIEAGLGLVREKSFYRNAYSMFTDPTSYQALFYFIVIKPGITILISLLLIVLVPLSLVFVLPAPAVLRLSRRLGIWQANVAVEGLCLAVR